MCVKISGHSNKNHITIIGRGGILDTPLNCATSAQGAGTQYILEVFILIHNSTFLEGALKEIQSYFF